MVFQVCHGVFFPYSFKHEAQQYSGKIFQLPGNCYLQFTSQDPLSQHFQNSSRTLLVLLLLMFWSVLFLRFCCVEADVHSHRNYVYPVHSINNMVGQILSMGPCTQLLLQSCKGMVLSQLCKTHSLRSTEPLFCHTATQGTLRMDIQKMLFSPLSALCRSFLLRFPGFYQIIYHLKW